MIFSTPLQPAVLVRRYKRFLADCRLANGDEVTAHCANPGSMAGGLADPGIKIWLEPNDDPKKKLKYAWKLVETHDGTFIGVDTSVPNKLVKSALNDGAVAIFADYKTIRPEIKTDDASRIDFLLQQNGLPNVWVEVKSVTLSRRPGIAEFPDSVTARGTKHMAELAALARTGAQAVLLFIVQRTDAKTVTIARDIDPNYAEAVRRAQDAGVQIMALSCAISSQGIRLGPPLEFCADL